MSKPGISVLILTLNEEEALSGCLDAVSWSDDIVVYDSFSSDRTVEIAEAAGARVVQRTFDSYAGQRGSALNEVTYKYEWVLMADADERWGDSLYDGMAEAIAEHGDTTAIFHFRRTDYFFGKPLKHSLASSTWTGRLVKPGHMRVERAVNEEYLTDEGTLFLPLRFEHHPFIKGIAWWLERHNRYSTMEAEALLSEAPGSWKMRECFSSEAIVRRKAMKQLAYRMPLRPLFVFIYLYFIRLGFLDGHGGLLYSTMRSVYEFMIDLKVFEIRFKQKKR